MDNVHPHLSTTWVQCTPLLFPQNVGKNVHYTQQNTVCARPGCKVCVCVHLILSRPVHRRYHFYASHILVRTQKSHHLLKGIELRYSGVRTMDVAPCSQPCPFHTSSWTFPFSHWCVVGSQTVLPMNSLSLHLPHTSSAFLKQSPIKSQRFRNMSNIWTLF